MEGEAAHVGLEVAAVGKISSESLWLVLLPANSRRPAQGLIKEWGFLSCLLGYGLILMHRWLSGGGKVGLGRMRLEFFKGII